MTVSSETRKSGPYNGNGSTTVFAYGFRIIDASHISVVRTENSLDTVLTTGFTVSGVGSAGGNVTFSVAPSVGQTITLIRNVPLTQEVDLENQGAYYAETVEASLDLAAMRDQQLQEQIDRSVKLAVGADVANLDLLVANITRLADSADQVDAVAAIEADVTAVAAIAANVSTVANNLADVTNFADVYQGGKAVAPTTRNDGSALQVGDIYFDTVEDKMKVLNGLLVWEASASSVNGTLSRQVYTATSGQTVFAIVYDVGYVDVWLNGVKLVAGDDFTATDGATVTLAVGATLGDSVDIVAFGTFVLSGMMEKSANLSDVDSVSTARANLGATTVGDAVFTAASAAAARTAIGAVIGTDVQAYDADLTALAGLASAGMIARTGAGTVAARTLTAGTGISISNGDGVAGNPTISSTGGMVLLGTIATTSGSSQSLSGLTLTGYTELRCIVTGVSVDGSPRALNIAGVQCSQNNGSASDTWYGVVSISLASGVGISYVVVINSSPASATAASGGYGLRTGYTTASTSITFSVGGAGNFDAGSILVYGVN